MGSYKYSISGDSRYLWFYFSFPNSACFLPCCSSGISECLFFIIFLTDLAFSCLLCRWLSNSLTECEGITYLCAYVYLMLFCSWFAAVCLKDLWVTLVIDRCIILQYVFQLILGLLTWTSCTYTFSSVIWHLSPCLESAIINR